MRQTQRVDLRVRSVIALARPLLLLAALAVVAGCEKPEPDDPLPAEVPLSGELPTSTDSSKAPKTAAMIVLLAIGSALGTGLALGRRARGRAATVASAALLIVGGAVIAALHRESWHAAVGFSTLWVGAGIYGFLVASLRGKVALSYAIFAFVVFGLGIVPLSLGAVAVATMTLPMNSAKIVLMATATAGLLTAPGGPQLAQLLVGDTRTWTAANDQQERYWSTTYPTAAIIEMMRLVDLANAKLPLTLDQSVLTLYSPNDQVVSVERMQAALARIDAPRLETVALDGSGDPSNHVLAGNILAPENNQDVAEYIVQFLTKAEL